MALANGEMGKFRVRYATKPSGYLHIVDAHAALLTKIFVDRYGGELIVRFDDTNPAEGSNECVTNILKDIETLEINYDKVTHASDYFHDLMLMAEKLIRQGKAYVDVTDRDQWSDERHDGIESKCRNQSVDENLNLWEKEMVLGTERGLKCCLRGKLDMQNPNPSLRDPVYYRCSLVPHHRVGSDYKVYPTYDFATPFLDSKQANYLTYYFVENGLVDGWDDPRYQTVQGVVRRGLKPEALYRFISEQDAPKRSTLMSWDKIWNINKKLIDPVSPRHTAVIKERCVLFTLTNGPSEPFVKMVPRHKTYEGAGVKEITFTKSIWIDQANAMAMSVNGEVTLMDWGNAIVETIAKDQEGIITAITGILHLEGCVRTTELKLTWLPKSTELVSLTLTEFGDLVKEGCQHPILGLNECSKREVSALGDSNMKHLERGNVVQLERKGYFRCDVPYHAGDNSLVLFAIPDGKTPSSFH